MSESIQTPIVWPECPVCLTRGQLMDDASNSGLPNMCSHEVCIDCWQKILESDIHSCPLCRHDVSEWLYTTYPLDEDEDEDEVEEDEND